MRPAVDLPIQQKTYDLVLWYLPILNKWPRDHKFLLGDRIGAGLYDLLEELVICRYEKEKLERLTRLNGRLDLLRQFRERQGSDHVLSRIGAGPMVWPCRRAMLFPTPAYGPSQ